jgi:hypothetical protein
VIEGMCKYESLIDGTINLEDLAFMNEALDVRAINQERLQQAAERNRT